MIMGHPDEEVGTALFMTSLRYGAVHCVGIRCEATLTTPHYYPLSGRARAEKL